MIKAPKRGEPITAMWTRQVTDVANSYNAANVKRIYPTYKSKKDSASEHPFKLCVLEQSDGTGSSETTYSICLPPGSIMWGMKELDPVGEMEVAKIKITTYGSGETTEEYNVDGRFNHVYEFEKQAGQWEMENVTIGNKTIAVNIGDVYCLIYNDTNEDKPSVAFVIASKNTPLQKSLNAITKEENQLAVFLVARVTKEGIEQIARGVITYGGASGGGSDVKIFETNGQGDGATGYSGYTALGDKGYRLFIPEIALGAKIPDGSRVLGHAINLIATGGSEK